MIASILLAPIRPFQAWMRLVREGEAREAELKASGLCAHCGKRPPAPDDHRCFECFGFDVAI